MILQIFLISFVDNSSVHDTLVRNTKDSKNPNSMTQVRSLNTVHALHIQQDGKALPPRILNYLGDDDSTNPYNLEYVVILPISMKTDVGG
jgi:hypothetical protein